MQLSIFNVFNRVLVAQLTESMQYEYRAFAMDEHGRGRMISRWQAEALAEARERIRGWRRSVGVENGVEGVVASHHEVEVRI